MKPTKNGVKGRMTWRGWTNLTEGQMILNESELAQSLGVDGT